MRPQWGAFAGAKNALSVNFVNQLALDKDVAGSLGLTKRLLVARGTRKLNKRDMLHNDACPNISVNPQTFEVSIEGKLITCEPAKELPLTQRYMLR